MSPGFLSSLRIHNWHPYTSTVLTNSSWGVIVNDAYNPEKCLPYFCNAVSLCCDNLDIRGTRGPSWRLPSPRWQGAGRWRARLEQLHPVCPFPRFHLPGDAAWWSTGSKVLKITITKASDTQDKALKAMSTVPYTLSTQWIVAVLLFSMREALSINHSCCFTSSYKLFGRQAMKHSSKIQKCGHFSCCLFSPEPRKVPTTFLHGRY